jgi:glyoxylase-like metal-dependent hydrolase (beta-lactamase superfamily II)
MGLSVRHVVVGLFQENTYVLMCERTREAIVIDPGDEAPRILKLIESMQAKPVAIYATHAHIDHVGAIADLQERYGIKAYAPDADGEWIDALPLQAQMFRLPSPPQPRIDGSLADGQRISFGEIEGIAIATPGHTEGGTCFYFEREKVLITGDTLFAGSVGRTDLPGGSWATLEKSIRERLFSLPDDVMFYPGHGEEARLGDEKRHNPFVGEAAGGDSWTKRMP